MFTRASVTTCRAATPFRGGARNATRTRQLHSGGAGGANPNASAGYQQLKGARKGLVLASAAVAGATVVYVSTQNPVYADAAVVGKLGFKLSDPGLSDGALVRDEETLHSLVWGSNRGKVLSPGAKYDESIRTPAVAKWLDGVALRDLKLHESYGACVDANGDVYQWGDGFFGELQGGDASGGGRAPKLTLKGKNILQLQLTGDKVYGLSASGHIYVFAREMAKQVHAPGTPTPASDSWWGTGWLWGEDANIDFIQLESNDKLERGERFASIAAGKNHLLAVTSKGRAFAHPVNKLANHYGQLGFRKFAIPDPGATITHKDSHLHVELVPKSLSDPFVSASRSVRVTSDALTDANLSKIDDTRIRFCPFIYEIPVLRGVDVAQVAAGSRSSFVRSTTGRVLGWGANEYGQLGLGSNVALNTIIVPTEVILWRTTPGNMKSTCTDVISGGDLTAFIVDRGNELPGQSPYTELLMAGNGQYGGLGNNTASSGQSEPTRVKTVSGLHQYNDLTKRLDPIKPDDISISPTGHVLLALNSAADSEGVGGSDVQVWGRNFDHELGNGKKGSMSSPINLEVPEGERLMLMGRKAKEVKDLHGKVWKRGVKVEQRVATGYGNSVVYWKIEQRGPGFGCSNNSTGR
ncbi:RCC1/BLIP-II [Coprinopsis marcescibilis]|uniref:RCC1/BLIP-II n=1 Tax=Coprinopsis marcescibilis TaxID=230819 RepID=A0A5C3L6N0_COPMA|nr:RCC1/BLIP-II [Coprinopsis marcescibilis]